VVAAMLILYILLASVGSVAASTFGYLKYRAYVDLAKHVVDVLGEDGLSRLSAVEPPAQRSSSGLLRVSIPKARQRARSGTVRASPALKIEQLCPSPARRVATGRPPGRTPGAGASGRDGA
jgi:hypothetical protein